MYSQQFLDQMKQKLEEEKERLSEELGQVHAHTQMDPNDDEWEDTGALELQVDEVNQDIIAQLKNDLAKIDAALARVSNGTYGVCSVGGEEINEARLEVIPWAENCVEHDNA